LTLWLQRWRLCCIPLITLLQRFRGDSGAADGRLPLVFNNDLQPHEL
jgi:hypothetical protein